ncbi:MAG: MFS transporter [Alphaproteobacteria bacterium]|nr:MFS transporter [Alphaproteobacteria bacterium]
MITSSSAIPFRSWILLISIGVLIFLMNIDYTAVNLTLVPISEEMDANLNSLQWLLSGYVLVWAAFVIPAGRIADLFGKRETLIGGLVVFMVGSCLTGLGQSIEMLVVGRFLQGFGAAIFTAPAWALIFTTSSPEKQGFVMGVILSFAGFGLATGPTLAGFIIEELSWRWIFYINIPLGFFVIAILMLFGQKDAVLVDRKKIDFLGTVLLASGLCITVYAINQIEIWGLNSYSFWELIALGIFLITLFILQDRGRTVRMIPPHFFKNREFMTTVIGVFFIAMNFSMVLVLMGLYLQNTLHYSSYETGLIFISMTISMGFLSPVGGKVIDIFGLKGPMIFGALLTAMGIGLMAFLTSNSSLYFVITTLFIVGTGLGAYFTACNVAMMRAVPAEDLNVASGIYMMLMMLGNTLSIILSTSFVVLFGQSYILNMSKNQGMALTSEQHQDLVDIISKVEHTALQLKDFPSDQIPQLLHWVDGAYVYGLSINMTIGALFATFVAGLTLWGIKNSKSSLGHAHAPMTA